METKVSPANIQERSEKLAAAPSTEIETAAPEIKVDAPVVAEVKPEVKPEIKPEVKLEVKNDSPKAPNDPAELRKWATKASQENALLREEIKGIKTALEKMTKKPVDYKELAKNPDLIQKQIELERQEAIAEMQDKLQTAMTESTKNETVVERIKREQDTENYPEWKRVFPLIQNLASNTDGRINFNQKPSDVLDALYQLAVQLSPAVAAAAVVVPPVVPGKTAEEVAALEAAAEKRGFEKAQAALKAEQAGAGIGSAGTGGRRNSATSKEALQNMPLKDLKALISKE